MKIRKLAGVGIALLLGGCASVEMAPYKVTSFAEVPLKEKSTIKIVANDDALTPIVDALKGEFAKSGAYKVSEENADYWFVLSGAGQYVKGAPQTKVTVAKKDGEKGGSEVLAESKLNLASAAKGVSVAVYETKTLAPVHYFEIPIYTGDNTEKSVRSERMYDVSFTKDVVERVKDAFITQTKAVETPMPKDADGELRSLFANGDYKGFVQRYKALGPIDLAKFCEQIRTKTYEGGDAANRLSNYYLYLLVSEASTLSPEKLAKIRDQQLLIIETCDARGLAEAVPVALARLEYKLANVGE